MKKSMIWVVFSALIVLSGCQSTSNRTGSAIAVGPGTGVTNTPSGAVKKNYQYSSNIYLDVAVPVFDPGFPMNKRTGQVDYDELDDMDIWPQLRRAEAKRFSVQTRNALQNTKAFGSVSAVPTANTTADLFVLGTVLHSDSEVVELEAMVVASSGEILGTKTFEHTVSKGFFRDVYNKEKNPYAPVFDQIASYVYSLVTRLSEEEKKRIQDISLVRYAQYYSPEAFADYTKVTSKRKNGKRYNQVELVAMPADADPMLKRIETLRQQEMLYVDRLQDQFDVFDKTTEPHYRKWQSEALPEVVRARKARTERNTKTALGILGAIAVVAMGKNSDSTGSQIAQTAGAIGSAWLLKDAWQANQNLRGASAVIDEMGQGLDIAVSPTVMEFNEQQIELSGTATEQYEQWKAHLKSLYELETAIPGA